MVSGSQVAVVLVEIHRIGAESVPLARLVCAALQIKGSQAHLRHQRLHALAADPMTAIFEPLSGPLRALEKKILFSRYSELSRPKQDQGTGAFMWNTCVLESKLKIARLGPRVQDHPFRCQIEDVGNHRLAARWPDVHGKCMDWPLDPAHVVDHRYAIDSTHFWMYRDHVVAVALKQLHRLIGVTCRLGARPEDHNGLLLRGYVFPVLQILGLGCLADGSIKGIW